MDNAAYDLWAMESVGPTHMQGESGAVALVGGGGEGCVSCGRGSASFFF